jgi:hypothetical protein
MGTIFNFGRFHSPTTYLRRRGPPLFEPHRGTSGEARRNLSNRRLCASARHGCVREAHSGSPDCSPRRKSPPHPMPLPPRCSIGGHAKTVRRRAIPAARPALQSGDGESASSARETRAGDRERRGSRVPRKRWPRGFRRGRSGKRDRKTNVLALDSDLESCGFPAPAGVKPAIQSL